MASKTVTPEVVAAVISTFTNDATKEQMQLLAAATWGSKSTKQKFTPSDLGAAQEAIFMAQVPSAIDELQSTMNLGQFTTSISTFADHQAAPPPQARAGSGAPQPTQVQEELYARAHRSNMGRVPQGFRHNVHKQLVFGPSITPSGGPWHLVQLSFPEHHPLIVVVPKSKVLHLSGNTLDFT